jgi:pimeloyl-ACP methyl ester carboxylesterase
MGKVTSKDGTRIDFNQTGQGKPVIVVDGALCYRAHWGQGPLAEALADQYSVYTFDRRGRGESGDTQPYAVEREIEDIAALIDEAGGSVYLYGISSGSVLSVKAAAKLGDKVRKLALYEPPLGADDAGAKEEFAQYRQQIDDLLRAGKGGDAVAMFLGDMMPPEMLEEMRGSPEWALLEAIAPTIAYDNAVMGDGAVPVGAARAATMPTLLLLDNGSPSFKGEAIDALLKVMPNAQGKTLDNPQGGFAPAISAPALREFFSA